ncbi:MAG: hypothetical protein JRI25_07495 [Deltaproteobacteria bacterium]|nr:hypothetical protein [Deltaproteobacteria bacterium]
MERIFHIARSFEEADRWDRQQQHAMTADERRALLKHLKERVFGNEQVDVRASGEARRFLQGDESQ